MKTTLQPALPPERDQEGLYEVKLHVHDLLKRVDRLEKMMKHKADRTVEQVHAASPFCCSEAANTPAPPE